MNVIPWILLGLVMVEHLVFLPKLFEKAGLPAWQGRIPGLNYLTWLKMIGRPWYWIITLIVPGINLIMLTVMHVEAAIVMNRRSAKDQWLIGALPWWGLYDLAAAENTKYVGRRDWSKTKKSAIREWGESILWAVVVASIVRAFVFEAFTIPTGSMEGSMLVGDYLYVSKTAYGPRVPETPFTTPFVHNVLPGSMIPSYTTWFSLPHLRLPGLGDVERYDAVVFNFPHGDTIVVDPMLAGHDYYAILRREGMNHAGGNREAFLADESGHLTAARKALDKRYGLRARPMDKMENYVKRCVGLPGETIEVIDRVLHVDGKALPTPAHLQFEYVVTFPDGRAFAQAYKSLNLTMLDLQTGVQAGNLPQLFGYRDGFDLIVALTEDELKRLENSGVATAIKRVDQSARRGTLDMFPNVASEEFDGWDPDNLGPIQIPKAGLTIELNDRNWALYHRVIQVYDGHAAQRTADGFIIDGQTATSYTFEQNCYWMMGDNRHRSADSRMWGFVPETHIVGRASFVWFSKQNVMQHGEKKIRWSRMFKGVEK